MFSRHSAAKIPVRFDETATVPACDDDAIGCGGLPASEIGEQSRGVRLGKEFEETEIVVPRQRNVALVGRNGVDQEIEHAGRIRTTVDIVAEMHDAPVGGPVALDLLADGVMQAAEQVEAPMDVADCVDADVFRPRCLQEVNAQLPHHDQMDSTGAVGAQDDLLLDVA